MNVIVNLSDYCGLTAMLIKKFKEKRFPDIDLLESKEYRNFVIAMIDHYIQRNSLWCGSYCELYEVNMRKYFPWFDQNHYELDDLFIDEVLSEIEDFITRDLEMVIPKPTWHIVEMYSTGMSCIVRKGRDYRIVDWEKTNNGKGRKIKRKNHFRLH